MLVPKIDRRQLRDLSINGIPILDHGEVRLLDSMAHDRKVYGSARVSKGTDPRFASKGKKADRGLIKYLMRSGHGTPFEHAVFQFYIDAPIFVAREWMRHRIASYNEFSMRYAELPVVPKFYVPKWGRIPDPNNKQSSIIGPPAGSDSPQAIAWHNEVQFSIRGASELAINTYKTMLRQGGVAREMARMVLPVNMYTQFWFTVDARSLMNFISLRAAPAAQYEIQEYARALEIMFAYKMPMTHAAFEEYGRQAP